MAVDYEIEPNLTAAEFIDLLNRSGLGERRPVDDNARVSTMLKNASIILTARIDTRLVGVSRALTDYAWCTYLSDLAVDRTKQRQGIGRELVRRTHVACGLDTTLILLAAPQAETYYPRIGMQAHNSCWITPAAQ